MTKRVVLINAGNGSLTEALRAELVASRVDVDMPRTSSAAPTLPDTLHVLVLGADGDIARLRAHLSGRHVMVIAPTAARGADLLRVWPGLDEISLASDPPLLLAARAQRLIPGLRRDVETLDALTGALSRAAFVRVFDETVQQLAPDAVTGLMLFNIDQLKRVNDTYGHEVGDSVLRGVVDAARCETAPQDRMARVGGDAFVYLATRYDRDSILQDCRRLLARVAAHEERLGGEKSAVVRVTASAGLTFLESGVDFETAIRRADVAMYEAKGRGRQGLVVHKLDGKTAPDPDAHLRHFENVTRVASERVAALMAAMGRRLLDAARAEAHRDPVTGLLNRRHFDAQMPREVDRARQHDLPLSVALMDLDHFHDINMTYGWVGGDAVLRRFAEVTTASVRLTDWAARYGGEEFALVMPGVERAEALHIVERLRQAFAEARIGAPDSREMRATVSIGLVQWGASMSDSLALINNASEALLRAKNGGRNRVSF